MKKIKVAIVDDEPLARDVLQTYLQKISGVELVGTCKNALDAFYLLNKQSIDLLLLDINMPEISGTDFLKTLKNPPRVIFTTAYSEFAVESYELNAIDYLVKPIPFDRFLKAMNKAVESIHPIEQVEKEKKITKDTSGDKMMFVRSEGKWIKIDITKLWFVEGLKDYIRLWTDDGRITVHSTMKNFEEQLSPFSNFVRVHKSHIVNMEYISEVDGNFIKIKDQLIGIGSTYRDEINKLFAAYKFI
jgi:DNA-binding LytR/AlgR family response regulator